ncbi:MAG: chromosome partitioning ATPase-like protein, partial [Tateyamaria sp.]
CGKSTLSANLALGLGRQNELHSILFELDLRRPSLAKTLGAQPTHNIDEMLGGALSFDQQAMRLRPNVAACLCSAPVEDPSRYMLHGQTSEILDEVEKTYAPDAMLFDMPPLLVGDDTRAFLRNVDCALIVARAEVSTATEIDICEKELGEHTNVLGVVLNQCRHLPQDDNCYGYGAD